MKAKTLAPVDYVAQMIKDLPTQFRDKPLIEALYDVIGEQLQEIYQFYDDLKTMRYISTAEGVQLDRIGEIVVLSRAEAQAMFQTNERLPDEDYRRALIYKTLANFGDATYGDIVQCIRILRDGLLGFTYAEDPLYPATIILETKDGIASDNFRAIAGTPIPRAGGVGLLFRSAEVINLEILHGVLSRLAEERQGSTDECDVETELSWYANEDDDILADENNNILVDG